MPGITQREATNTAWRALSVSTGAGRAIAAPTLRQDWRDEASIGTSLVVGREQGTVVVTLHGELDGSGSAYVAAILDDLIDGQGNLAVSVDLHRVRSIDRATVEALAVAAHQVGRHGGELSLARPIPAVREVLVATGLAGLIVGPQPPPAGGSSAGGDQPTRPVTLHPAGSNCHRQFTKPSRETD